MEPFEIAMAWNPNAQHDVWHQWLREHFAEVAVA